MNPHEKPPFEVPKIVSLDGKEVTEDRLLDELTADRVCLGGSGNNCSNGGANKLDEADEIA